MHLCLCLSEKFPPSLRCKLKQLQAGPASSDGPRVQDCKKIHLAISHGSFSQLGARTFVCVLNEITLICAGLLMGYTAFLAQGCQLHSLQPLDLCKGLLLCVAFAMRNLLSFSRGWSGFGVVEDSYGFPAWVGIKIEVISQFQSFHICFCNHSYFFLKKNTQNKPMYHIV